ncbi:MAG: L-seryl-tRNA(Sec) selenium transferase [Pseudomonadota bacterium]
MDHHRQTLLKQLPSVDQMLLFAAGDDDLSEVPRSVLVRCVRAVIQGARTAILNTGTDEAAPTVTPVALHQRLKMETDAAMALNLRPLVNATGVVVHTNLGRSLLAPSALAHLQEVAVNYSNLEYDLAAGRRGSRYTAVDSLVCELTGAEAAMVVNNNAAAVLLCLNTVARGKEVVISRGELVEIGGSFRIPDVMEKSGCTLKEVGTTNRTHPRDYETAVTDKTGLLLKVHTSNFSIQGFTSQVPLAELVDIGRRLGVPVMEDLGSGTLVDFSAYGLVREPTVQDSVASGADLISFSGDKLLGGPQAGIIVGKTEWIARVRQNPLTRALRIDKLTLAALESTLRLYRDEATAVDRVPTLRMITLDGAIIRQQAETLQTRLSALAPAGLSAALVDATSRPGGGSLPTLELPTTCVAVTINDRSAGAIERAMRRHRPPIIGRVENDRFLMDLRTLQEGDMEIICAAFTDFVSA